MEGIKRRHLGAQAWREALRRFDSAGVTVGEFCQREGLSKSSFQRWRTRLTATPSVVSDGHLEQRREPAAAQFVDLGSLGTSDIAAGRLDLKLDLGGGLVLHLVRG